MRLILTIIAFLASSASVRAADASAAPLSPFVRIPPAVGKLPVSGHAIDCRDFRRRPVRMVDVEGLGDAGRAEFIEGMPIIFLDPAVLESLPANLQFFFKLHECGHHALGHLFAPSSRSEKEADCWAINEERRLAGLAKDDVIAWKPQFAASRGSQVGHLPGPQRIEFLLGCFDGE